MGGCTFHLLLGVAAILGDALTLEPPTACDFDGVEDIDAVEDVVC